jgi:ABC-type bacteriocin/lantibiotic exporter with double-glycine peptidase domain
MRNEMNNLLFVIAIITLCLYSAIFVVWLEFVNNNNKVFAQSQSQNNITTSTTCDYLYEAEKLD